jgi:hypothetical protein
MNECDQISVRTAARKVRQRAEDRSVTNNLYALLARTLVDFGVRVMPTGQVTRAPALTPATSIIVDAEEAMHLGLAGEMP